MTDEHQSQLSGVVQGLGVFATNSSVLLYYHLSEEDEPTLHLAASANGLEIDTYKSDPTITIGKKRLDTAGTHAYRISRTDQNKYFLSYKSHSQLYGAESSDLLSWERIGPVEGISQTGVLVPDYKHEGDYIMFYGDATISIARSKDLVHWTKEEEPLLETKSDHLGQLFLAPGGVFLTDEGIVLVYFARSGKTDTDFHYSVHAVLLDKRDPRRIIWLSDALWEQNNEWTDPSLSPIGVVYFQKTLISYWNSEKNGIFAIPHSTFDHALSTDTDVHIMLNRHGDNPIIKPIQKHYWESKQTFNAAAVVSGEKIHLLYRAIGDHDTSVLGYASTTDGVTIDQRLSEPVYIPTQPFETPVAGHPVGYKSPHISGGGGYGGIEDPRITKIGDTLYMTYVAFDGSSPPRVALTSISESDFLAQNWNWDTPVLISKPGEVNKNCVIFPEKINGKYVIMHRVYPNMLIDYVDDLHFDGKTKFLETKAFIPPTRTGWDSRKLGAGAPPIKTEDGWLLIYQAVGEQDSGRYKIGAMLLDHDNPEKVLFRSRRPILAPDHPSENEGFKAGVVYPCGAVQKGDDLLVYYGGADTVVCAAHADTRTFLTQLKSHGSASLESVAPSAPQAAYA